MAEVAFPVDECTSRGVEVGRYQSSSTPALSAGDFAGSGNQMTIPNDGKTVIYSQTGGTTITMTVQTVFTLDGLALADLVLAIPANARRCYGPFPREIYGDVLKFALNRVNSLRLSFMRHQ